MDFLLRVILVLLAGWTLTNGEIEHNAFAAPLQAWASI